MQIMTKDYTMFGLDNWKDLVADLVLYLSAVAT